MKNYRNLSSVIRQVVTEAHTNKHPPFTPDEKSSFKKPAGAGQPRAQALAQRGREAEIKKIKMKMRESFGLDITYEEADDLLNSIPGRVEEALNPRTRGVYNPAAARKFVQKHIKPEHRALHMQRLKNDKFDDSYGHRVAATIGAADLGHLTTGNDNPKHDIKEESTRMKEWNYTPKQHREIAAEHLEDAKAHEAAGNKSKHHAAMMDYHDSMMKAAAKEVPPIGGTFKSNEFGDR